MYLGIAQRRRIERQNANLKVQHTIRNSYDSFFISSSTPRTPYIASGIWSLCQPSGVVWFWTFQLDNEGPNQPLNPQSLLMECDGLLGLLLSRDKRLQLSSNQHGIEYRLALKNIQNISDDGWFFSEVCKTNLALSSFVVPYQFYLL